MLLVFAFVLSLFAGRLFQVQGVEGAAYSQEAIGKRTQQRALPAVRGQIVDRDGVALATSVQAYDVEADPTNVKDADLVGRSLAPIIGVPAAQITAKIVAAQEKNKTAKKPSRYLQLAQRLGPTVRSKVYALKAEQRSGITLRSTTTRAYPSGAVGANIVGFLRNDGTPGAGLEVKLDDVLRGSDGREVFEGAKGGAIMPTGTETITPAVDGKDVQLTIDRDIQWKAQQAIAAQVKASKADWGSVVVLDTKTGEVYAMANSPTLDPNHRSSNPATYVNQAVADAFEPGSTSKVMTVSSAINEGTTTPSTVYTVPDQIHMSDKTFHDDETHRTWHPTTTGILAKSSNVGTIEISTKLAPATLEGYIRKFGLGAKPGTGLEGETGGIFAASADWSGSQRWTIAFGQGIAGSLLQMAGVYQTLANGGVRVPPTVVEATTDAGGDFVRTPAPKPVRVVTAGTAKKMMSMMEAVTYEGGTGKNAIIDGYRVAGKTGTAWIPKNGGYCRSCYQSSFIGVVPADKPRLVVAVTISNPHTGSHFGGTIAAPVFKEVGAFALSTLNIPPSGSTSPVPNFGDVRK
ncbi:cell division protein FtsI (penicillin-binding protein 3) [Motilibacter peucedani]|uniref:Cell division protein FtsI (Penicillin-binding protein 3) n=1 Tax=Motilibacter peucedani TaxID=598650 RepID=A0A420XPJ0_9ACTN|nr:penicillin-binding protein 2 [Motilibacter peucedani]RKS74107.1 cell division protein FtsI (penicillin-binding protein 3) [Motilibacter peucedani]